VESSTKKELAQFEIMQCEEQLIFTFFDDKGDINQRLHIDYLNYRMKSIERRHKHLCDHTQVTTYWGNFSQTIWCSS